MALSLRDRALRLLVQEQLRGWGVGFHDVDWSNGEIDHEAASCWVIDQASAAKHADGVETAIDRFLADDAAQRVVLVGGETDLVDSRVHRVDPDGDLDTLRAAIDGAVRASGSAI